MQVRYRPPRSSCCSEKLKQIFGNFQNDWLILICKYQTKIFFRSPLLVVQAFVVCFLLNAFVILFSVVLINACSYMLLFTVMLFLSPGECLWLHLDLIKGMLQFCRTLFSVTDYAYTTIPTYPSGQIGFVLCSKNPVSIT